VKFQDCPKNRRLDTDKKALCSTNKVPLIIKKCNQTHSLCSACMEVAAVEILGKIAPMKQGYIQISLGLTLPALPCLGLVWSGLPSPYSI